MIKADEMEIAGNASESGAGPACDKGPDLRRPLLKSLHRFNAD
jgi:hypothetical protein